MIVQTDTSDVSVEACRGLHVIDKIIGHRETGERIDHQRVRGVTTPLSPVMSASGPEADIDSRVGHVRHVVTQQLRE